MTTFVFKDDDPLKPLSQEEAQALFKKKFKIFLKNARKFHRENQKLHLMAEKKPEPKPCDMSEVEHDISSSCANTETYYYFKDKYFSPSSLTEEQKYVFSYLGIEKIKEIYWTNHNNYMMVTVDLLNDRRRYYDVIIEGFADKEIETPEDLYEFLESKIIEAKIEQYSRVCFYPYDRYFNA